jgi:very-short-patch-repair endonuclease
MLVDPIENVLDAVARCQPFEAALVIWDSALNKRLVERHALERLALSAAARSVLEASTPWADSGIETIVVHRLRWLGIRLVPQAWIAGRRVDLLIGDCLVLQIDGNHHVGPQRERDIAHDAELLQLGYHVIRVGYFQVMNDWPAVQHAIMRAVAQGLHLRAA